MRSNLGIYQIGILALIIFVIRGNSLAQDYRVVTLHFYFDTDVSNQLRGDVELNFTDQDDGWLNGAIKYLKVIGYADCRGSISHNQSLSESRAKFIANNIVKLGVVDADFPMEISGRGEQPCATDGSDDAPNSRRVDVVMTYEIIQEPSTDTWTDQMEELGRVELVGVNFQPGRHLFLPESTAPLNQLLVTMQQNLNLKIELQGHICCQPIAGDGQDIDTGLSNLSEARAKAVYDYLVENGIDPARLRYKGLGNLFPKVRPELTEEDRVTNRRVEAVIWN